MGDIVYLYSQQITNMNNQNLKATVERECTIADMTNPLEFAERILNIMGRQFPFPVAKLARVLGFEVEEQEMNSSKLSGYIACDDNLQTHTRLIRLNADDSLGHKRFTIAHELWHYFERFSEISNLAANGGFYSTYRTDLADRPEEMSANTFAANLLMPKDEYVSAYEVLRAAMSEKDVKLKMSAIFGVSETAIDKRHNTLLSVEAKK